MIYLLDNYSHRLVCAKPHRIWYAILFVLASSGSVQAQLPSVALLPMSYEECLQKRRELARQAADADHQATEVMTRLIKRGLGVLDTGPEFRALQTKAKELRQVYWGLKCIYRADREAGSGENFEKIISVLRRSALRNHSQEVQQLINTNLNAVQAHNKSLMSKMSEMEKATAALSSSTRATQAPVTRPAQLPKQPDPTTASTISSELNSSDPSDRFKDVIYRYTSEGWGEGSSAFLAGQLWISAGKQVNLNNLGFRAINIWRPLRHDLDLWEVCARSSTLPSSYLFYVQQGQVLGHTEMHLPSCPGHVLVPWHVRR